MKAVCEKEHYQYEIDDSDSESAAGSRIAGININKENRHRESIQLQESGNIP